MDLYRQAEERFSERVTQASMQITDLIKYRQQQRVAGASVLAGQSQFVAAVQSNDINATFQIARVFMTRTASVSAGAIGVRVYDPTGRLLLRAEAPENRAQRTVPPNVLKALQTGVAVESVQLDETMGLAGSGIVPVRTADGRMIAAVEVINSLDQPFVRYAASLVNANIAVIVGNRVAANSDATVAIDPSNITNDIRAQAKDTPVRLGVENGAGKKEYLSQFITYRDEAGGVVGDLYIGIDHAMIDETVTATRGSILRTMVVAMLAATAAALAFGWLAVRPMRPLLAAAVRLQHNDLDSPVPASGPTELRRLGLAMEDMRLAIRQSRDALRSANRDLAMRASTSDASLSEVTQDLDVMQAVVSQLAGESVGDSAGGLPGVTDVLLRFDWVDGAFVALATETGELSTAALAGLPPAGANAVLSAIEPYLAQSPDAEFAIEDTSARVAVSHLPSWLIGGLAVAPMLTPDGTAGVLCVTSLGSMSLTPQRREFLRSIAHEVTATLERSELADEVEDSRRVAEAILREMADGVIVVDYQNIGQICNPAAARLLGLPRAQIVGRPAGEWMPVAGATLDSLRERALDRSRGTGSPLIVESAGLQLAITAGPFPDPDPDRAGVILLIRDLSAEAEAERVKRDFVSMVGHELRTPLTLICTTIDLLHSHDAGELNATQQRIAEVLLQNSDRLMSLISDLLDMSALDSGRMQIAPASVSLVGIVNNAARSARAAIEDHRHRLRVIVPDEVEDDVMVWADAARIEQVLSNLLSNAIKYTPPGTTHRRPAALRIGVGVGQRHRNPAGGAAGTLREVLPDEFRTPNDRRHWSGPGHRAVDRGSARRHHPLPVGRAARHHVHLHPTAPPAMIR